MHPTLSNEMRKNRHYHLRGSSYNNKIVPQASIVYIDSVLPFIKGKHANGDTLNLQSDYFLPVKISTINPNIALNSSFDNVRNVESRERKLVSIRLNEKRTPEKKIKKIPNEKAQLQPKLSENATSSNYAKFAMASKIIYLKNDKNATATLQNFKKHEQIDQLIRMLTIQKLGKQQIITPRKISSNSKERPRVQNENEIEKSNTEEKWQKLVKMQASQNKLERYEAFWNNIKNKLKGNKSPNNLQSHLRNSIKSPKAVTISKANSSVNCKKKRMEKPEKAKNQSLVVDNAKKEKVVIEQNTSLLNENKDAPKKAKKIRRKRKPKKIKEEVEPSPPPVKLKSRPVFIAQDYDYCVLYSS